MPNVLIRRECPFCEKTHILIVPAEGWTAYNNGVLIQDAFPNMTADEREFILTGICPECWDSMVGDEDDD